MDAYGSVVVRNALRTRLKKIDWMDGGNLWDYYTQTEMPFTRVLWNMERRGFQLCTGHLKTQIAPIQERIADIKHKIMKEVGWLPNLKSANQLRKLFFEQLKYTPVKKTKPGKTGVSNPSTDESVLKVWMAKGCPVSRLILDHRELTKVHDTYIMGMLKRVDPGHKLHTTLTQHVAATGRLSSTDPNLQNLPKASDDDEFLIRAAFIPEFGKALVCLDYDQIEMKIMAHFSQDPKMIEAILQGMDLHCFTVSQVAKIDYEEVYQAKKAKDAGTANEAQKRLVELRNIMKTTGFGILYGIGRNRLAIQLAAQLKKEVTKEEAQKYIDGYLGTFLGVKQHIKDIKEECRINGFVRTIAGRYRRLPTIHAIGGESDDDEINARALVGQAERQAVNVGIQGSAADIAKQAMLIAEYDEELASYGAEMLLQVHDELLFQCNDHPDDVAGTLARAKEIMENTGYQLAVPLTAAGGWGYSWAQAKH
jgi:DNA polymerase-1